MQCVDKLYRIGRSDSVPYCLPYCLPYNLSEQRSDSAPYCLPYYNLSDRSANRDADALTDAYAFADPDGDTNCFWCHSF
jgi:hypothetical protein